MTNFLLNLPEDITTTIWHTVWQSFMISIEKEVKIEFVLKQFKKMGADLDEIKLERNNFLICNDYYNRWCGDISSWCSGY